MSSHTNILLDYPVPSSPLLLLHSFFPVLNGHVSPRHKVVGDVRAKVHREPDAHDEVDHGDRVQVDAPQRHEPDHAQLDGEDGEGDPQGAEE